MVSNGTKMFFSKWGGHKLWPDMSFSCFCAKDSDPDPVNCWFSGTDLKERSPSQLSNNMGLTMLEDISVVIFYFKVCTKCFIVLCILQFIAFVVFMCSVLGVFSLHFTTILTKYPSHLRWYCSPHTHVLSAKGPSLHSARDSSSEYLH